MEDLFASNALSRESLDASELNVQGGRVAIPESTTHSDLWRMVPLLFTPAQSATLIAYPPVGHVLSILPPP